VSVIQFYEETLKVRGFKSDEAQQRAVARLQILHDAFVDFKDKRSNVIKKFFLNPDVPKGVYLWGGVGRGKSFLMDCLYSASTLERKTRLHFHEFMRGVHAELDDLRGTVDPLKEVANRLAKRYRLICFDEFHVSDIADAMILYRLLHALFENGVSFVMTSNYQPDDLYPNGLHRDRMLPAIELLKNNLDVLNVDAGTDYRRRSLLNVNTYHSPILPQQTDVLLLKSFKTVAEALEESPVIDIESRQIRALRRAGGVIWFDFQTLCGGPRSQNDYLEIASRFHTVLLSNIPKMGAGMASEARRFTWLIDVFYDHKVKLIMSAEVPPEELYTEGAMAHEFFRTVSRIVEMQSEEYQNEPRRRVGHL
jgi:cell division protein ZapE